MNLDKYLSSVWSLHDYNCWNFTCDVWADLTKVRLHSHIEDWRVSSLHGTAESIADGLVKLSQPVSPCIVLMQRRRINPHVGVYVSGKVLQLNEKGASYLPLNIAAAGYPTVSYYRNS